MPLAWVSESQIESIAERSDRQVSAVGGDGGGGGGGGVLTVGGRQDAKAMEGRRCPDAGAAAAPSRGARRRPEGQLRVATHESGKHS